MRIAGALALALLAGCGGGGGATGTAPTPAQTPTRTTTTATTPTTPTATIPTVPQSTTSPPARTTTTTTTSPEQQPGGAGDEEAPRVPVQFTYRDGKLAPPLITVPATFRLAVTVAFADTGAHTVALGGRKVPVVRAVAAVVLPGLVKGKSLTVTIDGKLAGKIASGLQPGP